jgi:hypothetical protein
LGRLDDLNVGHYEIVEKCKLLINIWYKLIHGEELE